MTKPAVIFSLYLLSGISVLQAAPVPAGIYSDYARENVQHQITTPAVLLLAENGAQGSDTPDPMPGTLLLPDDAQEPDKKDGEKKCMTVCARWGEECQYINRGTGGLSKKCRRTCKQFTEECF